MFGGNNMQQMMKQVQKIQKEMETEQEKIEATDYIGSAPQDLVRATVAGDRSLKDLQIKPEIVDPDGVENLQDMIIIAVNEALKQVDDDTKQRLGKYTGQLGL
ncbi:YbaB/EbfC family nucleoid-associated protein [Weissella soli]|jgi:DNA-binding YbaB/EbfC family protein|uniref:YbaB/EbfC family nucleoid-associated protein n=1 Tax=Weissella soli TaxID=155866 RepID=UPI001EEDEA51|nr:YbaB/EbfC family nucleoid-associated protein [Weissella soli]GJM48730.1 nucleoid-associated protein [Weissella soli]